jgi:hypothetical protein
MGYAYREGRSSRSRPRKPWKGEGKNIPKIVKENVVGVYDAPRSQGSDHYTVVLSKDWTANPGFSSCLGFNDNPEHPAFGISQMSECRLGRHLGKKIKFTDLPKELQRHVIRRLKTDD